MSRWTEEEVEFLENNYERMTDIELGRKLNRTQWAVFNKRKYEGLEKEPSNYERTEPPEWVKGYIAGLLDGEGHIGVRFQKRAVSKYEYIYPKYSIRVAVKMTELGGIKIMQRYYGGNIHIYSRQNPEYKDRYCISFGASHAEALLRDVVPYLQLERKRKSAKLCLALRDTMGKRGVPVADKTWAERERIYQEFRSLK